MLFHFSNSTYMIEVPVAVYNSMHVPVPLLHKRNQSRALATGIHDDYVTL